MKNKVARKMISLILLVCLAVSIQGCSKKQEVEILAGNSIDSEEKIKLQIYAQYSDDNEKIPFDYAREAMKEIMPEV